MKKLIHAALLAAVTTSPMAVAAADEAGTEPDVLVWGQPLPSTLDPHAVWDVPMQAYAPNVYDTLYRYQGNPPELVPWLAKDYTVSDDGLEWTFTLKDDITFHDGSPLTAEDVVYTFRRLLALGRGPAGAFLPVLEPEGIQKVDENIVKFTLTKPYAPFLSAVPMVAIVNEDVVRAHEANDDWGAAWLSSHSAGSGAYIPDPSTYIPQEKLDLAIYPDHFYGWSDNPDPIEIVHFYPVQETSTRVLALLEGTIDATDSYLPTDQVKKIEDAEGVHVEKNQSMRVMLIRMNNQRPPFDNPNFRKCVNYAFNYEGFIDVVLGGYPVRNKGPIPQNLWGVPEDLEGYTYDLEKAKEFCDKARAEGAPVDRTLEIDVQNALEQTTQAAQILQSGLAELGLDVEIVGSTWPALTSACASVETTPDMWVHWVSTYFVDPENWIGQMYDSQFQGTWKACSWYQNDHVDELLRKARTTPDREVRAKLYKEAERAVVGDAVDTWIYNTVTLRGMSDKVKGFKYSPVGAGARFRWMSIED